MCKSLKPLINNCDGAVLIISLLILTVLTILSSTATMLTQTDIKISKNYTNIQDSFLAAESGVEFGRDSLLKTIRVNSNAWNDMLAANPDGTTASDVNMYELKSDGTWDSTTLESNINLYTNKTYLKGSSGSYFKLSIRDNDDGDGNYKIDTDFSVILVSTGNDSKIIEVSVTCPNCEEFYSQERYAPENPGSISTQVNQVENSVQSTISIPTI